MSKDRWTATAVPGIRRAMVKALASEAVRLDDLRDRALAIGRLQPAGEFEGGAHQVRQLREAADHAELYWVTGEMAQVALDASHDVPGLDIGDCPYPDGLLLFSKPLPGVRVPGGLTLRADDGMTDSDAPVPVDGILWARGARDGVDVIAVELLVRTSRLPGPLYGTDMPLSPFQLMSTPLPVEFDGMTMAARDEHGVVGEQRPADPQMVAILAFLSACWVLMMTPTVAERKSLDGRWGGRATGQTKPGDLVTAVDLRPLRYIRAEHDSSGRRLTTRHIVRGHWTHQPHGRDRAERRLQWIAPYVRGPEGAPLVQTEKVMVWRR